MPRVSLRAQLDRQAVSSRLADLRRRARSHSHSQTQAASLFPHNSSALLWGESHRVAPEEQLNMGEILIDFHQLCDDIFVCDWIY